PIANSSAKCSCTARITGLGGSAAPALLRWMRCAQPGVLARSVSMSIAKPQKEWQKNGVRHHFSENWCQTPISGEKVSDTILSGSGAWHRCHRKMVSDTFFGRRAVPEGGRLE